MGSYRAPPKKVVLIVEDDPLVQAVTTVIVEDAGFDVAAACNFNEALSILESRNDIGILFTDIDIPGRLNGIGLARAVRDRWPHIKIIATSGHMRIEQGRLPANAMFVPKPYAIDEISHHLQRMIA